MSGILWLMSEPSSRLSSAIGRSAPKGFSLASIRGRVVLFAVLAALIPTAITGWIAYRQTQRSLERGVEQELRSFAMQSARAIDTWIYSRKYDAQVFASSFEVSDRLFRLGTGGVSPQRLESAARISGYLASVLQRSPEIVDLAVVDLDGVVVGKSGARSPVLPALWQTRLHAGQAAVGEPHMDSPTQQSLLSIVVPVRAGIPPQDRLVGGLVATSSLTGILAALGSADTSSGAELSLIRKDGRALIGPRGRLPEESVPPSVRAMLADSARQTGPDIYRTADDTEVIGTYSELHEQPWAVLAELPVRTAYAEVHRVRNLTLLVLLGALLAVGVVAYVLAQLVVRPLDRLTRAAGVVASGDFAVELPRTGGGEVGYLTDVFNFMVERLRVGREELQAANRELERLSVTDALTGLYNRRLLLETMVHEIQRSKRTGQPFSVLMLDIDGFKAFNDTYGHQAGDRALVMVAQVIRESVRVLDTVARYGGEEFVVILPETDLAGAADSAERIRSAVESHRLSLGEINVGVTLSAGVAEFPTDGETVESIIASADQALYRAKEEGRNRVVLTRANPLPPRARRGTSGGTPGS
jgi:diguanylate cyclase (GGDEF)-like protein